MVAIAALEVIAAHTVLGLEVADDRLDRGAALHLAADRTGDATDLAGDPDPELVRMVVAAIAAIDMNAAGFDPGQLFQFGDHWGQSVAVKRVVVECLGVQPDPGKPGGGAQAGGLASRDLERVVVDTTVQSKAIAHPTDARLCYRALHKLVDLTKRNQLGLRQSYVRVAKRAPIIIRRYTAHQFKRARRELKFLRTRLGRVIRDIRRKIAANPVLGERFAGLLALAVRARFQDHRQRGPKSLRSGSDPRVYSLHAPEVECIGKSLPMRRQGVRRAHPTSLAARACPCESRGVDRHPGDQAQKPALAKAGDGQFAPRGWRQWVNDERSNGSR